MRVVSNTSPILNLAIIGQLDLLHQQFGQVWIPLAVVSELKTDENRLGSTAIQQAMQAGWLKTASVTDSALVQSLENNLDLGEAEAIALTLQLQAEYILLDERDGRKFAKRFGLNALGVLGILIRARHAGHIASLAQAIQDLQDKAAFRTHPSLLTEIKALPEYQRDIKQAKESNAIYASASKQRTVKQRRRAVTTGAVKG